VAALERTKGLCGPKLSACKGAAHCPQNLKWGGLSVPHFAQRFGSGAAQLPQNLVLTGLSSPHREQVISHNPFCTKLVA
jgi:hypothetical protein